MPAPGGPLNSSQTEVQTALFGSFFTALSINMNTDMKSLGPGHTQESLLVHTTKFVSKKTRLNRPQTQHEAVIFSSLTSPGCYDAINLISGILFQVVFFITLEVAFLDVYVQLVFHILKRWKNFMS